MLYGHDCLTSSPAPKPEVVAYLHQHFPDFEAAWCGRDGFWWILARPAGVAGDAIAEWPIQAVVANPADGKPMPFTRWFVDFLRETRRDPGEDRAKGAVEQAIEGHEKSLARIAEGAKNAAPEVARWKMQDMGLGNPKVVVPVNGTQKPIRVEHRLTPIEEACKDALMEKMRAEGLSGPVGAAPKLVVPGAPKDGRPKQLVVPGA